MLRRALRRAYLRARGPSLAERRYRLKRRLFVYLAGVSKKVSKYSRRLPRYSSSFDETLGPFDRVLLDFAKSSEKIASLFF